MKKTKLLMPVLAVAAFGATTMPLLMTSCKKKGIEIFDIDEDGTLLGFKDSVATSTIKSECGDTLTIPKKVKRIADFAFLNNNMTDTVIPSFIENFEFEKGYQCKEIGVQAFAYAPFKNINITCDRAQPDGKKHDDPYWQIPKIEGHYSWGLTTIRNKAFFHNRYLQYIKLPATMFSWGNDCFRFDVDGQLYTQALPTLDFSDWCVLDDETGWSQRPNAQQLFGETVSDNWHFNLIIRWHDGIYGPDRSGQPDKMLTFTNMWREMFGAPTIADFQTQHNNPLNSSGTATVEWWGEPE